MPESAHDRLPFHLRIRFRREREGLRQWQLAKALGIHNTLLSAFENGRRLPPDPDRFERSLEAAIALVLRGRNVDHPVAERSQPIVLRRHGLSPEAGNACLELLTDLARLTGVALQASLQPEPGAGTLTLHVSATAGGIAAAAPSHSAGPAAGPVLRLLPPVSPDAGRATG